MSYILKVENDSIILQLKELFEDYPQMLIYDMDKKSYPFIRDKNLYSKTKGIKRCSSCNKTEFEINTSGHDKECEWRTRRKTYESLYNKLNRFEKANLELIINEINE